MPWQLTCTWELLTVPGLRLWVRQQPLPTAPQPHLAQQPSRLCPGQGLFLCRSRPFWPVGPALPCPPQDWTRCPPWCLLYFYLPGTVVWGPANPDQAGFPVDRGVSSYCPQPCLVPSVYESQGPDPALEPFTEAQEWTNLAPLTKRVLKPLVRE